MGDVISNSCDMKLDEWLAAIFSTTKNKTVIDYQFPTDAHAQEYLLTIRARAEQDVVRLIGKFLFSTGSFGADKRMVQSSVYRVTHSPQSVSEFDRRLLAFFSGKSRIPPWEGITWVLDLLPDHPRRALEVIDAYFIAHCQALPDGRMTGLRDAADLIRAKFIGIPETEDEKVSHLLTLSPREFEQIVARLYEEMGYVTSVTPAQKDGGRDIIAVRSSLGKSESIRIEVKRHRGSIGVPIVRQLLGVVADEKVNKGVLVTTSYFTIPAKLLAANNPRLELISGSELVVLFNEFFGLHWPLQISRLLNPI